MLYEYIRCTFIFTVIGTYVFEAVFQQKPIFHKKSEANKTHAKISKASINNISEANVKFHSDMYG